MPLYDYECGGCGHVFEAFKPVARRRTARCPLCREKATKLSIPVNLSVDDGLLPPSLRGYWPAMDRSVTTKREVADYCEEHGCTNTFLHGNQLLDIRRRKSKQQSIEDAKNGRRMRDFRTPEAKQRWREAQKKVYAQMQSESGRAGIHERLERASAQARSV